jgi:hypothetical protein
VLSGSRAIACMPTVRAFLKAPTPVEKAAVSIRIILIK